MLNRMNAAFQRMKVRKEFRPVQGWIRTTEVTRGSDGSAHPHFHPDDGAAWHAKWEKLRQA